MIKYEDDCVGCPPEMGCMGNVCKYKHAPHYYCDVCGEEYQPEDLFMIDDKMVCEGCAEENHTFRELLEDLYGTVEV
ncbi:MAG: hypothetical protein LUD47_00280 [Clostridia bacterium]|nr:hypothetical protein [Clostridia bacterium]